MPRPEAIQHDPDPRCRRFHPDALPTHRRCPTCKPGADVHPLDVANFYERKTRFPWNLSRFTSQCRDCHRESAAAGYAANAEARNARSAARRRVVKLSKLHAAIFYTPPQVAIRERKATEQRERKERIALLRRRNVRSRGGYSPERDGIKLMIRERSAMYQRMRQQARRGASAPTSAPLDLRTPEETQDAPGCLEARGLAETDREARAAESAQMLARLRAQHAAEAAQRNQRSNEEDSE